MKIAVDARTMGSYPSGIGIYTYDFVKMILQHQGWKVILLTDICESAQMKELKEKGAIIQEYGYPVSRTIMVYKYSRYVLGYLNDEQPEIFWEPNNLFPLKLPKYKGKVIVTIHDLFPMIQKDGYSFIYRMYFKINILRTIKYAHGIIYNSKTTQKSVNKLYPMSISKSEFVSYAIVPQLQEGVSEDGDYFLYIGNLEKRKGTDILLNAYQRYWKHGGRKALYLVGKVRDSNINHLLKEIELQIPGIKYKGYLNEEEKKEYLRHCTCFVFPSRAEGFGTPPLEAMAYGKELLLSDLDIFDEIIPGVGIKFHLSSSEQHNINNLEQLLWNVPRKKNASIYERNLKKYSMAILGPKFEKYLLTMIGEIDADRILLPTSSERK